MLEVPSFDNFCLKSVFSVTGLSDITFSKPVFCCRIESLPTIKKYMEADDYMPRGPFHGPSSAWGGGVV